MITDWKQLTVLTQGQDFRIERIRLTETAIAIEGNFELPALAKLTFDDQVFVAAFVRSNGSIREMEKYFGVSYPTIKNRLNRIAARLEFVKIASGDDKADVLSKLERGEISAEDAIAELNARKRSPYER